MENDKKFTSEMFGYSKKEVEEYIKDMKMGVLVSYDQINDGFLDPDTQKHPYFPMIIKKNALF